MGVMALTDNKRRLTLS